MKINYDYDKLIERLNKIRVYDFDDIIKRLEDLKEDVLSLDSEDYDVEDFLKELTKLGDELVIEANSSQSVRQLIEDVEVAQKYGIGGVE